MCFYIDIKYDKVELEKTNFKVNIPSSYQIPSGEINGFSKPQVPIIHSNGIGVAKWGLVPHWIKSVEEAKKVSSMTLNAKIETIDEKPSFRDAWEKKKRCLIPVSGFYEWRHEGKNKIKHYITCKDEMTESNFFTLAGIWSVWERHPTFTILTTQAKGIMQYIHNSKERMPLAIPKSEWENWLSEGELKKGELNYMENYSGAEVENQGDEILMDFKQ